MAKSAAGILVAGLDAPRLVLQEVFIKGNQQVARLVNNRVPDPISQAACQPRFAQAGKSKLKGMGAHHGPHFWEIWEMCGCASCLGF